jgi:hypothetical protein
VKAALLMAARTPRAFLQALDRCISAGAVAPPNHCPPPPPPSSLSSPPLSTPPSFHISRESCRRQPLAPPGPLAQLNNKTPNH